MKATTVEPERRRAITPPLRALRRHPLPMRAHFDHSLVLTYALPPQRLAPLLSAGLDLDTYRAPDGTEHAFVAIALVALRQLRPAFLPAGLGLTSVMTGYRVFTRFPTPRGRTMRGLRILRSDTDRRLLALGGNLLTGYHYHRVHARVSGTADTLRFVVDAPDGVGDLDVTVDLAHEPPTGPVFATPADARRFAGPLPYTFSPEPDGRVVVVKAMRDQWQPRPVRVVAASAAFLDHGPLAGSEPVLANAFYVSNVDYGWHRGQLRREPA